MTEVQTVLGPIPADELGVTLMHEHLLVDATPWFKEPEEATKRHLARRPVSIEMLGALRNDPFLCRDNCELLDEDAAIEEATLFCRAGGETIVDPTCRGIGRDPKALQRISRATGLNVVMGTGYYLEPSHPEHVKGMSVEAIAEEAERDVEEGVDGVRAGIIGEIGISKDFTAEEEKVLRGAAQAQARTGVPLEVHLPGWERHGLRVLDAVEEEGGDLSRTVLCHMNPSGEDLEYQAAAASRGAWLEYDMIGMDFYYADQEAQSPSDEESARAIRRLRDAGLLDRVLLSQDVFVKIQLVRYGGTGYAHILEHFVPRLKRHGFSDKEIRQLLVENPKSVFA
ncbi:MAG: phosphotriesterase-related protein [Actinomycetota bacterium]